MITFYFSHGEHYFLVNKIAGSRCLLVKQVFVSSTAFFLFLFLGFLLLFSVFVFHVSCFLGVTGFLCVCWLADFHHFPVVNYSAGVCWL